jgi:hypothetical protein
MNVNPCPGVLWSSASTVPNEWNDRQNARSFVKNTRRTGFLTTYARCLVFRPSPNASPFSHLPVPSPIRISKHSSVPPTADLPRQRQSADTLVI